MQASQSNTAADLLNPDLLNLDLLHSDTKSDPKTDSAFTRSFPSPLLAPIQAARMYLERHRGDIWQTGAGEKEPVRTGAARQGEELATPEQDSHEQDWCPKRNPYERHSIEADLNFEVGLSSEAFLGSEIDEEAAKRSLVEGEGSELPFYFASPGPQPHPDAVRNAILRLARESAIRHEENDRKQATDTNSVEGKASQPLNFSDVARQVWAGNARLSEAADHAKPGSGAMEHLEDANAPEANSKHVSPNLPPVARCDVEQEPALAHDACNLLSAITLYSDLLASPEVLEERHRHLAVELKLIASRSHLLIDRLLRIGAARSEEIDLSDMSRTDRSRSAVVAGETAAVRLPVQDTLPSHVEGKGTHVAQENGTSAVDLVQNPHRAAIALTEEVSPAAASGASLNRGLGQTEGTNLVDLLMCWGSLLSTLAHGTLDVVFGAQAATPVPAETEALERILVNLVRNARAATLEGGAIRIGVEVVLDETFKRQAETPLHVESAMDAMQLPARPSIAGARCTLALTVDDSGCGMTEAQVRRVLGEDEDSGHAAVPIDAARGRRHGLGLKIVRELVAASGGALSIQSWPGRGTRVEIRWPVLAAMEVSAEEKRNQTAKEEAATSAASLSTPSQLLGEHPSRHAPVEGKSQTMGPDGFTEADLRAMMLRLQRARPQERSPLSRRRSDRRDDVQPAARRFGAVGASAENLPQNCSVQSDVAAKGAIAC
jgi:signal transduction histidine kinase